MLTKLNGFIDKWDGLRIGVIGDVVLDVFMRVRDQHRTDPSQNFPILQEEGRIEQPGGAANAALNLQAMGADVQLVGIVGNDSEGDRLTRMLGDMAQLVRCVSSGRVTTCKTRVAGVHFHDDVNLGIRLDSRANHGITRSEGDALSFAVVALDDWAEGILLSDYGHGTICYPVAGLVEELDVKVHLDPHRKFPEALEGMVLHCMTPNTEEALLMWKQNNTDLNSLAGTVVVTGGETGARVHLPVDGFNGFHVPNDPVHNPRVCGAGDAFAAALLLSRMAGADWLQAVTLANAAGRAAVQMAFTSVVPADAVREQLPAVLNA